MGVEIFVGVCLLTIVEMWCDGVLEEVHQQISAQHEQRTGSTAQLQAFGHHFDQGGGEHETRAQCDEIAEIAAVPVFLHEHRATKNIGGGRSETKQDADEDWIHEQRKNNRGRDRRLSPVSLAEPLATKKSKRTIESMLRP